MGQSDEFSSRWGLIFATIGAAIGTGNIWRFPRMVGANGGGTFLIPWLFFLFVWSIPLVIAEFALGKRSRTGTVGTFRIFGGKKLAWMGLWTAWISTAIGFYYAVVAGWCMNYFQLGFRGQLTEGIDTVEVWNNFLMSTHLVILFQVLVIVITLAAILGGAKMIEKANTFMMLSLFALLFLALFLALWMDMSDGTMDGAMFMFSVDMDILMQPETWINGLSQSAWSCSAGMGMAITYAVYMKKDEDTTLNAFTMGLANNSISIIAGLTVLSAIFAVQDDPLATVTGGSSAITFLALPEVFAQAPGGSMTQWVMMWAFFLALTFAALTSMISTVELCVRNFVDHGFERNKAVGITGCALLVFGLPSTFVWIRLSADGVRFPEFLEVQDHIWGYGLMFSGLFIAYTIWQFGFKIWREKVAAGEAGEGLMGYIKHGVPAFRDEFINTGDNDVWIGRWWDFIMFIAFPVLFTVLLVSYFGDMIANTHDVWNPSNPHGLTIILLFWGVVGGIFIGFNHVLVARPLYRNVPEGAGAGADISMLPGGDDDLIGVVGDVFEGWEQHASAEDLMDAELS
ncbi:MAG: sodium-dependent transporter [Candidatus Thalassarchaeaceae archaeon]|nr:sodium-dependent transporter [Candidatus Thalassarchaeaceae archaeon]